MTGGGTTDTVPETSEDPRTTVERNCETFFGWCSRYGVDVGYDPDHVGTVDGLVGDEFTCPPYDRDDLVVALGCWIGEVCRRTSGGEWHETPDRGLCVRADGHTISPFGWAEDCLEGTTTFGDCYREFCDQVGTTPD